MHNGVFHKNKIKNEKAKLKLDASIVSVYFAPADKPVENALIPLVKGAKNYIYIPVYIITHKALSDELIAAKKRGVDVKIILDAVGAANRYSPVKLCRDSGIKLKVENRPGKMHMKSIVIDDKYTLNGSMNSSKSGESSNDENILIIDNPKMAIALKNYFDYLWKKIPDKWLTNSPRAESFDSLNS
jgi:phosphatidylserine/phosphatidylglycerophosphate/cardiolipin synthase-like enzyme